MGARIVGARVVGARVVGARAGAGRCGAAVDCGAAWLRTDAGLSTGVAGDRAAARQLKLKDPVKSALALHDHGIGSLKSWACRSEDERAERHEPFTRTYLEYASPPLPARPPPELLAPPPEERIAAVIVSLCCCSFGGLVWGAPPAAERRTPRRKPAALARSALHRLDF